MLWLVLVSMALMGFGIGTLVIAFQVITEATLLAFIVCCVSLTGTHYSIILLTLSFLHLSDSGKHETSKAFSAILV